MKNLWKSNIGNVDENKQLTFEYCVTNPLGVKDGDSYLVQSQVVFNKSKGVKALR